MSRRWRPVRLLADWINNLDKVAALEPSVVVAGHKKVENDDEPKRIGESQQYLRDFSRIVAEETTTAGVVARMVELVRNRFRRRCWRRHRSPIRGTGRRWWTRPVHQAEKATIAGWKTLPSWYLVCEQDNALSPDTQRFMAKRSGAVTESVKGSHVAFISQPDVATALILKAVAAPQGARVR
jgi:hypothetical protein